MKLDDIINKLFSNKLDKKALKQNFLLNISLQIRHLIINYKKIVLYILSGIAVIVLAIIIYVLTYEQKVKESTRLFEVAFYYYNQATMNQSLSQDETK